MPLEDDAGFAVSFVTRVTLMDFVAVVVASIIAMALHGIPHDAVQCENGDVIRI